MTDTQLLTMAMAVIVPLSLLLFSNSRIAEAKETLRAEIKMASAEARAQNTEIVAEIRVMRSELKMHELAHHHRG